MNGENFGAKVATHISAGGRLERIADYSRRGRSMEKLSLVELEEKYISTNRAWAADISDLNAYRDNNDVEAEYALREIDPPFELVLAEAKSVIEQTAARYKAMTREELDEANTRMIADYEAMTKSRQ